jgi:hypothetical protein
MCEEYCRVLNENEEPLRGRNGCTVRVRANPQIKLGLYLHVVNLLAERQILSMVYVE